MAIEQLTARQVQEKLARGEVALVDVREPWELEQAHIAGALAIPLGELPARLDELPREKPLVFVCHHGVRSYHACLIASSAGVQASNLAGGIAAWSREVDSGVPQY